METKSPAIGRPPGAVGGNGADVVRDDLVWQQSQERVLRYLRALGVPPVQSLEIAHAIMQRATARHSSRVDGRRHPTRVAMQLLWQHLAEEKVPLIDPCPAAGGQRLYCRQATPLTVTPGSGKGLHASPPLRRRNMLTGMRPVGLMKFFLALLVGSVRPRKGAP